MVSWFAMFACEWIWFFDLRTRRFWSLSLSVLWPCKHARGRGFRICILPLWWHVAQSVPLDHAHYMHRKILSEFDFRSWLHSGCQNNCFWKIRNAIISLHNLHLPPEGAGKSPYRNRSQNFKKKTQFWMNSIFRSGLQDHKLKVVEL